MNIEGNITSIEYKTHLGGKLKTLDFDDFNINKTPTSFLLNIGDSKIAVSKWVSPKRTRSYPYERVYNTLSISKKITIIPIVKDEGAAGDRDFIQWDTIALMSLLDVYVIPAFYNKAKKRVGSSGKEKITKQQFDNDFIINEINKIPNYHSSALHWNLKQINELSHIVEKVKLNYQQIAEKTGVKLKSEQGIDNFLERILEGANTFKDFSRLKAAEAQQREFTTLQPKEALSSSTKAKITIKNYLGGLYYFTVDEIEILDKNLKLIEAKHTKSGKLPSKGDIKDGLLKMILYSNLESVTVDGVNISTIPVLKLTASKMIGNLSSRSNHLAKEAFFITNVIKSSQKNLINTLFEEAQANGFEVILENA